MTNFGSKVYRLMKKYAPITVKDLHRKYCIEYGSKCSYDSFRQHFWRLAKRGMCAIFRREKARIGYKHYYDIIIDDEKEWEKAFKEAMKSRKH